MSRKKSERLKKDLNHYEVIFDVDALRTSLLQIEDDLSSEDVWISHDRLTGLQKMKSNILDSLLPLEAAIQKVEYLEGSLKILDEEGGDIFLEELNKEVADLKFFVEEAELRLLLSGEADKNNAIVSIHPGAGGVESQDWAQMLMRMYIRWSERHGYKIEIIDHQIGEEAGIKGVTFAVAGKYAYGYLKAEAGIHRLVRISPFDANKRRHTSFAAVLVYPEIEDDMKIEIRDEDLKIDTFRSSGAGGQHVNKVSSAVRITHIPSGIIVACQSERSQLRNRELALKVVKARLYDLMLKSREKKIDDFIGDKKEISWGNQIRSYILQPYRLVKDHRTNVEVGDVDSVLDGAIDIFMAQYLNVSK
jgi:peptide chain release factor 2